MTAAAPGATAWIDATAGIAGDMLLAACLDAGAPLPVVQRAVDAVVPGEVTLAVEPVTRAGLRALRVHVRPATPTTSPPARAWADLRGTLEAAELAGPVRRAAVRAFEALAEAEARVHGVRPEDVHFHEVGAQDAIADIVGCCAALHALGVTSVVGSAVAVGSGRTGSAHGSLPVPVPAVVELLRAAGAPSLAGPVEHEACTPTGAALLAAWCGSWGGQPPLVVSAVGVGAGGRDTAARPNVTRLLLGRPASGHSGGTAPGPGDPVAGLLASDAVVETAVVLETNVDDMDPRLWPGVLERLLAGGAWDAWLTPILMKKGRSAHALAVLCAPGDAPALVRAVFEQTTAIGLRARALDRYSLARRVDTVRVDGEPIRVKVASLDGRVLNVQPEHDDVAAAATALGRPAKAVLAAAISAASTAASTATASAEAGAAP